MSARTRKSFLSRIPALIAIVTPALLAAAGMVRPFENGLYSNLFFTSAWAQSPPVTPRKPLSLAGSAEKSGQNDHDKSSEQAMSALKPFQILLGNWRGTTRKAVLDEPSWAWDFQSERNQPALVLKSPKGKYIQTGRLWYDTTNRQLRFSAQDNEGEVRQFEGTLVEPVRDIITDDNKVQTTFKLQFTQNPPGKEGETWQLVLSQQDNDRYLLDVNRRRGTGTFQRVDTVNTMRAGVSFSQVREDYGDKTCLISGGLGTISVSHQGKTYWVCCTGCKSAFEEDPLKWIRRYEESQKARK